MKLLRRTARHTFDPRLDEHLHDIFEDRRTPSAPEALYEFLREVPVSSAERRRGRFGLAWHGLGRTGRAAAWLAVVFVVAAGVLAVTVGLPRTIGPGGRATEEPQPIPSTPAAPVGWSFQASFGSGGGLWVGTNLLPPAPRIAIHVVCKGPDEVAVFVTTDPGMHLPDTRPVQALVLSCDPEGKESRVEMTAPSGAFQQVSAVGIPSPASLVDTSYVVSIEVPSVTPAPSASS
jgi:hypothetical protein